MSLNRREILYYFSRTIAKRGTAYYEEGRVELPTRGGCLALESQKDGLLLKAKVRGSENYLVELPVDGAGVTYDSLRIASCDCPYFAAGWECKHIVAVALAYAEFCKKNSQEIDQIHQGNNPEASRLLERYSQKKKKQVDCISVEPVLTPSDSNFPHLHLKVGRDKKYVVKNIEEFLLSIEGNKTQSYGKNLEFLHNISSFDRKSQELIQVLMNQKRADSYSNHRSYRQDEKRFCSLDGNGFHLFFRLFAQNLVEISDWSQKTIAFVEENPEISLVMKKVKKGGEISFSSPEPITFYGNESHLYALSGEKFALCTPEFSEKVAPLVEYFQDDLFIPEEDLTTFCDTVLFAVKDLIALEDEDKISTQYTPDDCVPTFYFDSSKDFGVTLQLKFRYGEEEIGENPTKKELGDIRLNAYVMEETKEVVAQDFAFFPENSLYILREDSETFLTEKLDGFREIGDVFLSSTLKNLFIDPKKTPSVGVSVADGLLTLDMDTGEFPLEELELLYGSLLKKKKYHKLKDGRFLFLDGSGYEKVAEITHMLQLSPKDLKKNEIKLPAYRGLYLDAVLDGQDEIKTKKNQGFRHMLKDFRAVGDSDYQPSELLQTTLRPYQIIGFQWMKTLEQYGFGGILADEMGLGKTVQVITYLLSLENQKKPSLIVCPASLLLNWGDELERFAPSLSKMLLLGSAKERKEQILLEKEKKPKDRARVWVTSYDLLKRDKDLYEGKKFYACILDEGQTIKNQSSLASKTVKTIHSQQRFVLTGTPIENRLSELWNLFDFLMPGYLFNHGTFLSKLEKPIVKAGDPTVSRQLSLLVQPFLMRRLKKDVLKELPDKIEHLRHIQLTEEERKVYHAAVENVKTKALATKSKLEILALLTHLRQICCDPALCFENYQGESSKLQSCLELCASMVENGHKILLFSQFTSMLDIIREGLTQENISHLTIEGATSKGNRAKYVKQFQEGQVDVFLISLKAGGTGLNLTNADVVIHYDPWWNQASQNQATDRAHRIGQKQHVQVYKLIAKDTIEEKILHLQEKKAALMESITAEVGDEPMSREDIMDLLG